ncbi:MAG: AAA family ATPase [Alphaproteobacteria bacterium]
MANKNKINLEHRLLEVARKYVDEKKHGIVEPFHILIALVHDPDAKTFLENLDFPFESLKEEVEKVRPAFDHRKTEKFENFYKDVKGDATPVFSQDVMGIIRSANQFCLSLDRDYVGYTEMLFFLRNMGDDNCGYLLGDGADYESDYLDDLILQDGAEWTPHMKIVPKASEDFKKASNDNDEGSRREKILKLGDFLKSKIFDQDEPIDQIHGAMKLAEAGMKEEDSTLGNYLLNGPTGVGKTELAKQIAKRLDMEFVRIDMSEYMERHSVNKLIGAPPGYVGYQAGGVLTDPVQEAFEKGKEVLVLMDEVDKAHPKVFNVLLQVMDDARLTNGKGETTDFRKTLLLMTSNIGEHEAALQKEKQPMGFRTLSEEHKEVAQDSVQERAIRESFSPEFRNRLDGVFRFNPLSDEAIAKIAQKFIDEMHELPGAKKNNLTFEVSDRAMQKFIEDGHDPAMGARPMKRLIKTEFREKVAELILEDNIRDMHLEIDYDAEAGKYDIKRYPNNDPVLMLIHDVEQDNEAGGDISQAPDIIRDHF